MQILNKALNKLNYSNIVPYSTLTSSLHKSSALLHLQAKGVLQYHTFSMGQIICDYIVT